ncbi:stimulated by retinoic acid 6 protein-like isoform X1, partial [Clarias magur]
DEYSNNTGSDSMTILKQECENYDQNFLHVSVLPAVTIILLLSLVERRKRTFACERNVLCLSGWFGITVPVDFTSTQENRWSYAFAFGAVTQHMVSLTFGISNPLPFTLPPYLKVFMYMAAAIKVGVACMPLFICVSTSNQLLGGILGLLYAVFWFSLQIWELVWCSDSANKGGLRHHLLDHEW